MFFNRFINIIFLSFYSKEFYKDLYYNVKSWKLGYIFLMLAIANLMLAVFTLSSTRTIFDISSNGKGAKIISQLPQLRLGKGVLSMEEEKAVIIYDGARKLAVIDTKSGIDNYLYSDIPMVIGSREIYFSGGEGHYMKLMDFSKYADDEIIFDHETLAEAFSAMHNIFPALMLLAFYPLGLLLRFIFLMINLSVFSFATLIYSKYVLSKDLKFKDLLRVASFASIPAVILDMVIALYLYGTNSFFLDFYYKYHASVKVNLVLVIAICYLVFAIRCVLASKDRAA